MKALIRRASRYGAEKNSPPIKGVKWDEYTLVDERTFKTFEAHDASRWGKACRWESEGENHRLTEVGIARDLRRHAWFIDVPDVWEFVREHGGCVVEIVNGIAEITIYDGYLE